MIHLLRTIYYECSEGLNGMFIKIVRPLGCLLRPLFQTNYLFWTCHLPRIPMFQSKNIQQNILPPGTNWEQKLSEVHDHMWEKWPRNCWAITWEDSSWTFALREFVEQMPPSKKAKVGWTTAEARLKNHWQQMQGSLTTVENSWICCVFFGMFLNFIFLEFSCAFRNRPLRSIPGLFNDNLSQIDLMAGFNTSNWGDSHQCSTTIHG